MKKDFKKPSKEAIAAAHKIPNLTLLEKVLAAEMIQQSWDNLGLLKNKNDKHD